MFFYFVWDKELADCCGLLRGFALTRPVAVLLNKPISPKKWLITWLIISEEKDVISCFRKSCHICRGNTLQVDVCLTVLTFLPVVGRAMDVDYLRSSQISPCSMCFCSSPQCGRSHHCFIFTQICFGATKQPSQFPSAPLQARRCILTHASLSHVNIGNARPLGERTPLKATKPGLSEKILSGDTLI